MSQDPGHTCDNEICCSIIEQTETELEAARAQIRMLERALERNESGLSLNSELDCVATPQDSCQDLNG